MGLQESKKYQKGYKDGVKDCYDLLCNCVANSDNTVTHRNSDGNIVKYISVDSLKDLAIAMASYVGD